MSAVQTTYPEIQTERRVLIVDDNPESAKTLGWMVEAMGFRAEIAFDGASALDTALRFRPQIVLMDIGLPGMDGYETCRRMRNLPELRGATMIAQTGWSQSEHKQRAEAAGFAHHLVKPIEIQKLQALLTSVSGAP